MGCAPSGCLTRQHHLSCEVSPTDTDACAGETAATATARDHSDGVVRELPSAIQRFQKSLIREYVGAEDVMDHGMMPEGVEPTVENVQVNLVMLPRHGLRQEFSGQTFASSGDLWRVEHVFTAAAGSLEAVQLHSLFSSAAAEQVTPSRQTLGVLAIASAGCGKTFVFTLVAPWKWALQQLWPELDLLVARHLRCDDVRQAKGLAELLALQRFGVALDSDRQIICDYVVEHPERVCVVLDGLDETSLPDCSEFVQRVVRGQTLRGIRLVVTSRPCSDVFALSESRQFRRRVELIGFRPSDVEAYIGKVLPAKEAVGLLAEVRDDAQLASMMATPFIAKETCRLYHHQRFVPRCVASLFERMIVQVAGLRASAKCLNWEQVPRKEQEQLIELGGFAFHMLAERRLIFTQENIRRHSLSDEAIALGVLVACDPSPTDASKQWRFSHLTMQECLAAKYHACSKPMTRGRIVRLVEGLGPLSGHLRTFWVLLAAQLSATCAECLVHSLLTRKQARVWCAADLDDDRFSLSDPFPLNFIGPLCEVIETVQLNLLAERLLGNAIGDRNAVAYVEHKMNHGSLASNEQFLHVLLTSWTDLAAKADEALLLEVLKELSGPVEAHCRDVLCDHRLACEGGCVGYGRISLEGLSFKSDEDNDRRTLAFRCFAEYAIAHEHEHCRLVPLPSITASLRHDNGGLRVSGNRHPAEYRTLDTVVRHHAAAVKSIQLENLTPGSASCAPASLAACTQIAQLSVVKCVGQWRLLAAVMARSCSSLTVLRICDSAVRSTRTLSVVTSTEMSTLAPALSQCRALRELYVSGARLSPMAGRQLASALDGTTELRNFLLSGSHFLGDDAARRICRSLHACCAMSTFIMVNCRLSSAVITPVAAAVRCWPLLTKLHLSGNDFADVTRVEATAFVDAVNGAADIRALHLPVTSGAALGGNAHLRRMAERASYGRTELSLLAVYDDDRGDRMDLNTRP